MHLNLGCGKTKLPGYINIDCNPMVEPDMVHDISIIFPFDADSIDEIRAHDVLEHVPTLSTMPVIAEIWRILKPGGIFDVQVPDAEHGQGAFMDPTHINFWTEGRFLYFCNPAYRKYYDTESNFKMLSFKRTLTDPQMRVYHIHAIMEGVK